MGVTLKARPAFDSASVVPIHTRSELSSDSDSAYDSASVASVNQPLYDSPLRDSCDNAEFPGQVMIFP